MDVHLWRSLTDGFHDIKVGLAGVIGMNATLQTDLCGAQIGSLCDAAVQLFSIDVISRATRRHYPTSFGERAEATTVLTHVGIVDVAIDHISDHITHLALAQLIRCLTDGIHIGIASAK